MFRKEEEDGLAAGDPTFRDIYFWSKFCPQMPLSGNEWVGEVVLEREYTPQICKIINIEKKKNLFVNNFMVIRSSPLGKWEFCWKKFHSDVM